jgi:ketosteroid isomerase-like protein
MKNSDIVRALYDSFATGDVPGVLGTLHQNVCWTEAEGFPYGGTYIGPNAVLENVFMKLGSEWEGFSAVPDHFVSESDMVVALGNYSGKFNATGRDMNVPFAHVWTLSDGKIIKFTQFTDTLKVSEVL